MNAVFANHLRSFWWVARTKMVMVRRYSMAGLSCMNESSVSKYNASGACRQLKASSHLLKNLIYRLNCCLLARFLLGTLIFLGCWLPQVSAQANSASHPGEILCLTANGQRQR